MIRSSFKNLKIQTKFTLLIAGAILVPFLVLSIVFMNRFYDMIISETVKNAQIAANVTTPKVTNVVDGISEISSNISANPYFEKIFFTSTGCDFNLIANSTEAEDFHDYISALEDDGIKVRIYMSIPDDSAFFSAPSSQDIFYPISKAKGTYWYGIFQGKHSSALYCPSAYLGKFEKEKLGDNAYITYMTTYDEGEIYPCYMALYYSSDIYTNILKDNMTFDNGVSYIINDREEIVASTDLALSATYRLTYSNISESLMSSNNFIPKDVLGAKVYVALNYVKTPGWFIVTVIPEKPLIKQGNLVVRRFIILVMSIIIIAIILGILMSRSITGRISKVVHQMSAAKNGPPIPIPEPDSTDEVGELITTYNYMAKEMQELILQEQRTAENLRIAEFNALQAQINPHFLYNTMDMINWMAKEGRTDEVSEVVQRLSRFYKLTLSRKNTINSIADELEHVQIYVDLMNMRHGNAIDLVIDMPDELTNFTIPKLTLQPIVENAILHGILEKANKSGTIIITGWEENDDILIIVSDDGVGIPADKIKAVLSEKPIGPTKGSNVAISNIHHRLQLLCGPGYGLTYSSTEGSGTEVTIRIPQLIG
ncbi:sensor histidine kinase [Pseudobutyrivibrio sp.]|uniref:sensor histidine kinase n=1 Tax=Pseudobutyrivibrio sp. TaxID=2014367 RepID=UPI001DA250BF|nr:histidine kinase [Pseudobutyrivibrio sp.]MBE5911456.1 HAMP domain-containing protein [Pseudobutyrivibrio sp.]